MQITFDLMRDPVLTPAGQTYESAALEQHLKHVGSSWGVGMFAG